jgi:hypothetical protein
MDIEVQLRQELSLKEKEISLILEHYRELQLKDSFSINNFNEMIKLLNELEYTLKENALYQEYVSHYEKENNLNTDYIIQLKQLINWFNDQNQLYKNELSCKNEELNDLLINMEQILIEKDQEIKHLNDVVYGKNDNIEIVNNKLKSLNKENEETNNHLIEANLTIYNQEKMISNNNKYILQLEYAKTDLYDSNLDKDVEIYKLYADMTEKERIIETLMNECEMLKQKLENEEEVINPLYVEELENEIITLKNNLSKESEEINLLHSKVSSYEQQIKDKDIYLTMSHVEINNLELKNKNCQNKIDELYLINSYYIELITNIKNFISETQQSTYIPLFNPVRILENLIKLFYEKLGCDQNEIIKIQYKKNCLNRC